MKREELNKLNQKWFKECKCELKHTATQPVPGDGNPNTEIIFNSIIIVFLFIF